MLQLTTKTSLAVGLRVNFAPCNKPRLSPSPHPHTSSSRHNCHPRHTTKDYAHEPDSYARSPHAVPSLPVRDLLSDCVRSDQTPFEYELEHSTSSSNISSRSISDIYLSHIQHPSRPLHIHAGIKTIDQYVTMNRHTAPNGCDHLSI
ncbi:hypothetical protein BV22DRAFT_642967 [Leucogyrophana mollusca]|uniref:Uncharacterized protein n=1 Tax=Leucogyrophana mollusca TaxID=85980 RepID=A0ACB8BCV1_9AGAM|nr:hypothetical protein BV22DRAFT_642967 [Leucogyrophana mollusca]